jgi:hypothetical protein
MYVIIVMNMREDTFTLDQEEVEKYYHVKKEDIIRRI